MIQRSGPLQPLAWPGLGNGPQLWHLRQNLEPFNTWNSTPILSLGTFLALSGHCIWSSMCPNGPSPSISWRIRYTSHHHLLSGCETHSLNSRFLRLFCPPWVQGPLTEGALPDMFCPGACSLWVLSEVKCLSTELQENTHKHCPSPDIRHTLP